MTPFELSDLPSGDYELIAFHPALGVPKGTLKARFRLPPGHGATIDFEFREVEPAQSLATGPH